MHFAKPSRREAHHIDVVERVGPGGHRESAERIDPPEVDTGQTAIGKGRGRDRLAARPDVMGRGKEQRRQQQFVQLLVRR